MKVHCRFDCIKCCLETEMLLSAEDVSRIEALGVPRDSFSFVNEQGIRQLRNVNGHCIFLQENQCSIYEYRPQGCRFYPVIMDLSRRRVVIDDDCAHPEAFQSYLEKASLKHEVRVFVESLFKTEF